jgi:hypothetical protein
MRTTATYPSRISLLSLIFIAGADNKKRAGKKKVNIIFLRISFAYFFLKYTFLMMTARGTLKAETLPDFFHREKQMGKILFFAKKWEENKRKRDRDWREGIVNLYRNKEDYISVATFGKGM